MTDRATDIDHRQAASDIVNAQFSTGPRIAYKRDVDGLLNEIIRLEKLPIVQSLCTYLGKKNEYLLIGPRVVLTTEYGRESGQERLALFSDGFRVVELNYPGETAPRDTNPEVTLKPRESHVLLADGTLDSNSWGRVGRVLLAAGVYEGYSTFDSVSRSELGYFVNAGMTADVIRGALRGKIAQLQSAERARMAASERTGDGASSSENPTNGRNDENHDQRIH